MADSAVGVVTGSGANIDVETVTTGFGTVNRQIVGIGDPATGGNRVGVVAKGTQGTYALANQDLKDSGRNAVSYFTTGFTAGSSTETALTLTGWRSGAVVTAAGYTAQVTTGKTFRVQSIVLSYVATATASLAKFTLRVAVGANASASSGLFGMWYVGAPSAAAGIVNTVDIDLPDGLEFAATTSLCLTLTGIGATGTAGTAGYGLAEIIGYEY